MGGGGIFSPQARIGLLVGEMIGSSVARPLDDRARLERERQEAELREARELAEAQRRAKVQAAADSAYDAERRRLDPTYAGTAAASDAANARYSGAVRNADTTANRMSQLVQEFEARNAQRQRAR